MPSNYESLSTAYGQVSSSHPAPLHVNTASVSVEPITPFLPLRLPYTGPLHFQLRCLQQPFMTSLAVPSLRRLSMLQSATLWIFLQDPSTLVQTQAPSLPPYCIAKLLSCFLFAETRLVVKHNLLQNPKIKTGEKKELKWLKSKTDFSQCNFWPSSTSASCSSLTSSLGRSWKNVRTQEAPFENQ